MGCCGCFAKICGAVIGVVGLVLLILGGVNLTPKLFRAGVIAVLEDSYQKDAPIIDYSVAANVSIQTFTVYNWTNSDAFNTNPLAELQWTEIPYTLTVYNKPDQMKYSWPLQDKTKLREFTVSKGSTIYIPETNKFFNDVIVTPNLQLVTAMTLGRSQFAAGTLAQLASTPAVIASACSLINNTVTTAFLALFSSTTELDLYFKLMNKPGGTTAGTAKYSNAGINSGNEKAVLGCLNSFARQAAVVTPPYSLLGPEFHQSTPFNVWTLANNKNCTMGSACSAPAANTYFDLNTGKQDIKHIGEFYDTLSLNGTLDMTWGVNEPLTGVYYGTNFPPEQDVNGAVPNLGIWNMAINRVVPIKYAATNTIYELPTNRYALSSAFVANSEANRPYNQGNNVPNGVIGAWGVASNAPIYLSLPHFLHGDAELTTPNQIKPFKADPVADEFTVDIEPITGLAVGLSAGIQASLRVELGMLSTPLTNLFAKSTAVYLPVYIKSSVTLIKQDDAKMLYDATTGILKVMKGINTAFIACGIVLLLISFVCCFVCCKKKKKAVPAADAQQPANPHHVVMQTAQPMMVGNPNQVMVDQNGNQFVVVQAVAPQYKS